MKFIPIGFGNYVSDIKIISVTSPDSAPIKRAIQESRDKGKLIDASFGRSTRSVIFTDSGHVILSALSAESIAEKL